MKTGWVYQGQKWYYLTSSGAMAKGWIKDRGTWYYLQSSGAMKTGWFKEGNRWYYLKSNGVMKTGWEAVSGQWYYFEASGAMKTGWLQLGNDKYFLDRSGAMQTGWINFGGDKYYFYTNGSMARNTIIDGFMLGSDGKANTKANTNGPEVYKITKSVAEQFGYKVQYDNESETTLIADGGKIFGGVRDGYVGGFGRNIDFLSAVSSKIGAPETPQNIKDYFTQIFNPSNPDYYERENFAMQYDRKYDWVVIIWGSALEMNR
jgi:hypothetical protein